MRLLALHGRHMNAQLFAKKIAVNIRKQGIISGDINSYKDTDQDFVVIGSGIEVFCLDGLFHDPPQVKMKGWRIKEVDCDLSKNLFRSWYLKDKSEETVEQSINHICRKVEDIGEIDGYFGFSQGAAVLGAFTQKIHETEKISFQKNTVLFSGYSLGKNNSKIEIKSPMTHVWSNTDQVVPSTLSQELFERFGGKFEVHNFGHKLPANMLDYFERT